MIRRICRECGSEMSKELTSEGTVFFCRICERSTPYDEFDMEPHCPECGALLQVCSKCGTGYFCSKCNNLVSSKKIVWKK
jgi:hypothetical protein